MKSYYSSGKLLLTGEYVVLDGAIALAAPTQFGQSLIIEDIEAPKIIWKSLDETESVWFEVTFEIKNNEILKQDEENNAISKRLLDILHAAQELNPAFLKNNKGYVVTSLLEFPIHWGLGTSSTLINNIANWAQVDAYKLLDKTFGGSGYDIACAQHPLAITYQLHHNNEISKQVDNNKRIVKPIHFNPNFKAHLYFVHLNKKQNSREGIAHYKKHKANLSEAISEISLITKKVIACKTLDAFCILIKQHEQIISKITKQKPIQEMLFKDFNGQIKSLGAWGGDFILAACKTNPTDYFKHKGFETILSFDDMITGRF